MMHKGGMREGRGCRCLGIVNGKCCLKVSLRAASGSA